MEIIESSKIFLSNYYVLEQTRIETHRFMEEVVLRSTELVNEHIKPRNNGEINFRKFIQKDGGYAEFKFESQQPLTHIENIGNWKYGIAYIDAMRSELLSASTKCRIYCFSPKNHAKQISELKRMALNMNLPDPYSSIEVDLLDAPFDEVVAKIVKTFIDFYDDFLIIVDALIEEAQLNQKY